MDEQVFMYSLRKVWRFERVKHFVSRVTYQGCNIIQSGNTTVVHKTGLVKWGASSRLLLSLYFSIRNSDQMTIRKTCSTLLSQTLAWHGFKALVTGSDWFPYRRQIDTAKTSAYAENYATYKRSNDDKDADDINDLLLGFPRYLLSDSHYYYLSE